MTRLVPSLRDLHIILLPAGKIWVMGVMIFVGMAVYGTELLVTNDPMVKIGFEYVRNGKKA